MRSRDLNGASLNVVKRGLNVVQRFECGQNRFECCQDVSFQMVTVFDLRVHLL